MIAPYSRAKKTLEVTIPLESFNCSIKFGEYTVDIVADGEKIEANPSELNPVRWQKEALASRRFIRNGLVRSGAHSIGKMKRKAYRIGKTPCDTLCK